MQLSLLLEPSVILYLNHWFLQLKNLLMHTLEAWVNLFDESNKQHLPILKMELIYEDDKMQFYPTFEDLEEVILFVVDLVVGTLQSVPTVQSWLAGSNTTSTTDAKVAEHIIQGARQKLKEAVRRYFEEPDALLKWYGE